MRDQLIAAGLFNEMDAGRKEMDDAERVQRSVEKCTDAPAQASSPCSIKMHYIFTIIRSGAPSQVFAQALLGFQLNSVDPRFVGINIAAPEDGRVSMHDYHLHMQMLDYLHSLYPKVKISLHAGELAPGLVPPEGLRFHIRQAIDLGHAQRIGHGVDVMYEDNAPALLKELAQNHVMVEINLSSNEGILGVEGDNHPFPIYRLNHVPVALSTDDEGVSRIDITHEYVRAAIDYNLTYQDMKQLARTGMEHSFLPGNSLWAAEDVFTAPVAECKGQAPGTDKPSAGCKAFLDGNEKAAAQWEQERRFRAFEAKF